MPFKPSNLVELRTANRRWVYVLNLCVTGFFALWSLEEGWLGLALYIPLIGLVALQYLRPTLAGWGVLVMALTAFTVGALLQASFKEDYVGVLVGLVPTVVLFWAYPRPMVPRISA